MWLFLHAGKICDKVVKIDENVHFAAVIDEECKITESSKSVQHYVMAHHIFSDKFHYLLAQGYVRKFQCFSFLSLHRETYLELVYPMRDRILCVVCHPETKDGALSDKILAMISELEHAEEKDFLYARCGAGYSGTILTPFQNAT